VLFIVFLQNYFGISEVGKVMLDIYVIVLAIHLLPKKYPFNFFFFFFYILCPIPNLQSLQCLERLIVTAVESTFMLSSD
jgi:hypothetical protein